MHQGTANLERHKNINNKMLTYGLMFYKRLSFFQAKLMTMTKN